MLIMWIGGSTSKNPDDIVITYCARTPLTKAFKGGLKDTQIDYLLLQLFKVPPIPFPTSLSNLI
jgi:hypothetical protein